MKAVLAAVLALGLAGCQDKIVVERFAGVRLMVPQWPDRTATGSAASGTLGRRDREGAAVAVRWDPDERSGDLNDTEALLAAGLTNATVAKSALRIDGHVVLAVTSGAATTLVWRCDKTGRLFRLAINEQVAGKVKTASLAAGLACHLASDKRVNGEVPVADAALLGSGWLFARRQPASAAWLHDDAVLTLFTGQHTQAPRDPEAALQLAPGWVIAAGLSKPTEMVAAQADGPARHHALKVTGKALLDGAPVRFTLLQWHCIGRGKSFAAVVFTKDAKDATTAQAAAAGVPWTPHDAALEAVRCHG